MFTCSWELFNPPHHRPPMETMAESLKQADWKLSEWKVPPWVQSLSKRQFGRGHEEVAIYLLEKTPREIVLQRRRLLHSAVKQVLPKLLQHLPALEGTSADERNQAGETPLHIACQLGAVEMVQALLDHGADAWPLSHKDLPPLFYAGMTAQPQLAKIAGMILARRQRNIRTVLSLLLSFAATHRAGHLITVLLDAGADKNYRGIHGRTALHEAASWGDEGIVRRLLLHHAKTDLVDSSQRTPLMDAAVAGHVRIVALLLDADAKLNVAHGFEQGLFHWAATHHQPGIVQLLIDRGEGLQAQFGAVESSPLVAITKLRDREMQELVLKSQEKLRNSHVLSKCFHVALRNDDCDTASLLLQYGANSNECTSSPQFGAANHECAYYGNIKMACFLLAHPSVATANSVAGEYHTPLIAAVAWRYPLSRTRISKKVLEKNTRWRVKRLAKMVDYLLSQGADPTICGGRFGNLLNAAAARAPERFIEDLLTTKRHVLKLDISQRDHEQRSAFHMVAEGLDVYSFSRWHPLLD